LVENRQSWDPVRYAQNARFVSELGRPVLELLDAKPGELILDLGCGDGVLTRKLADVGCRVVGIDSSAQQVEAARKLGLDVRVVDARAMTFQEEFDAVFSNAALHWIKEADDVIGCIWRALRPGGRFVAECGGHGCVAKIESALVEALRRRGYNAAEANPWYFPTPEEYGRRLEAKRFKIRTIALIPRPTPLPGDITGWLETFAQSFASVLPCADRSAFFKEVRDILRPQLCESNGTWIADYVRLRVAAEKSVLS
jgi:trans-aconitate methyltransferase